MTAMAEALRAAGISPASDRLNEAARQAIEAHPRDYDRAYSQFKSAVMADPGLAWALFARFEEAAIRPVLAKAAQEYHAKHQPRVARGGGATKPLDTSDNPPRHANHPTGPGIAGRPDPGKQGRDAVTAVITRSLLDTFMIGDQPLGDVSASVARAWGNARHREARFIAILTHGVPDNKPLREWIKPEEADAAFKRAGEKGNE